MPDFLLHWRTGHDGHHYGCTSLRRSCDCRMDTGEKTWASVAHRLSRLSLFQGNSRAMPDMCIGRIRVHALRHEPHSLNCWRSRKHRMQRGRRLLCTHARNRLTRLTRLQRSAVRTLWCTSAETVKRDAIPSISWHGALLPVL